MVDYDYSTYRTSWQRQATSKVLVWRNPEYFTSDGKPREALLKLYSQRDVTSLQRRRPTEFPHHTLTATIGERLGE